MDNVKSKTHLEFADDNTVVWSKSRWIFWNSKRSLIYRLVSKMEHGNIPRKDRSDGFPTVDMCRSIGVDRGSGPPPPEKSQNIGFLSNTSPDPLKNHQSYQTSIQCWAIIGPFCWRADDGPYRRIWFLSLTVNKNVIKVWPPSNRTFWIRAWPDTLTPKYQCQSHKTSST